MKSKQQVLVSGGKGKTGSRVVQRLTELGYPVRIGSRSSVTPFDWRNSQTWEPVLQGMDAVYITYQPDLAVPEAVPAIKQFSDLAVKKGVKHLVLLSGRGEPEAQECERIVMNAGANWTIVRASWFFQNFSEGYMLEPILAGFVALPVGDMGEPFIDTDDIAEVVVTALTNDIHHGQLYEVTGPRLLSFKDAIREIATATGRSIQYQEVSIDEYTGMLKEYQVPQEYIGLLSYLFTEVLDGRNAVLTDGIELVLGRKPTDFSAWVAKTAATGVWQHPGA